MINKHLTNHFLKRKFNLIYVIFFLSTGLHITLSAQQPIKIQVFEERTSSIPISKFITGNFIERGIGRQVDGMWSEMLYNRAFQENITPFKATAWEAMQLDREHYNKNAPFWHSGYEENDWELLNPGNSAKKRTHGEESFPLAGADALN